MYCILTISTGTWIEIRNPKSKLRIGIWKTAHKFEHSYLSFREEIAVTSARMTGSPPE